MLLPKLPNISIPPLNLTRCFLNYSHNQVEKYLHDLLNVTLNFTRYELMDTTRHSEHVYSDYLEEFYAGKEQHLRRHQFISYIHSEEREFTDWYNRENLLYSIDFKEILDDFDFSYFKLIFLVLDVLLVLYRFTHMYINARRLCLGFEENVFVKNIERYSYNLELDKPYEVQLTASSADRNLQKIENDYSSTRLKQSDTKPVQQSQKQPNGNIMSGTGDSLSHKNTQIKLKSTRTCSLRTADAWQYYTQKLVQTNIITKCVLVSVMLLVMYNTLICVNELSSESFVLKLGAIFPVFSKLSFQADFTNWFVDQQVLHASESLENFYGNLGHSVLTELQGLVQYFNSGKF